MQQAKGTRVFNSDIQIIRNKLYQLIINSFEKHGFNPFSSSIIQHKDVLTFKFNGDEDVMNELFTLTDQGERDLALRFDLTVPLVAYVAENKDLKFPFKRYEVGRVYRDGPIKLGRYREFWQCDGDIIGSPNMIADSECIQVACDVLSELPFEYVLKVNNRKLLDAILHYLAVENKQAVVTMIDKLAKIGREGVEKELLNLMNQEQINNLFGLIISENDSQEQLAHIESVIGMNEGIKELKELLELTKNMPAVRFDPSLARGLNYYTSTIYEGFLIGNVVTSSVCGGGRYNNIIGQMRGDDQEIPAVGVSFGVEPLTDALIREEKENDKTVTQIYVVPIKIVSEALEIVNTLRDKDLNTEIDLMNRSISKNLDYADKQGIPLVIIIGQRDLDAGMLTVKNMRTGDEQQIKIDNISKTNFESFL